MPLFRVSVVKAEVLKQVQHDKYEILKQVLAFGEERRAGRQL